MAQRPLARNTATRVVVNGPVLSGRLSLENFIAFGEHHPRLLPASSDVPCRPQPGCIVQRATSDLDYTISRRATNPGATFGANEFGVNTSTISGTLKLMWLKLRQPEPVLGDNDRQGKRGAGQALAVQAVAGIDRLRLRCDLVANFPAMATARLWELHRAFLLYSPGPLYRTRLSPSPQRREREKSDRDPHPG